MNPESDMFKFELESQIRCKRGFKKDAKVKLSILTWFQY